MKGRLKDLTLNRDGSQNITVTVTGFDFRDQFDRLRDMDLDIEIRIHRERRSRTANAYFHVLVNKIAAETGERDEDVKTRLVTEYGAVARDAEGTAIGFMLPAAVDVSRIYPYTRRFDQREENGKLFNCWLALKHTSDMDTKEMARLIDGAIEEAKELGIETDTPETLARYQREWEQYEHQIKRRNEK